MAPLLPLEHDVIIDRDAWGMIPYVLTDAAGVWIAAHPTYAVALRHATDWALSRHVDVWNTIDGRSFIRVASHRHALARERSSRRTRSRNGTAI